MRLSDISNIIGIVQTGLCNGCGTCYSICPQDAMISINNNLARNKLIGNHNQLLYGYSLDDDLRYRASSGGIISTLLRYLVEKSIIDGFVLVGSSKATPFLNEPFVSTNVDDIYKYAGTRYFPIPVNKILKEINSREGKFAIVGTPCQIYGITKYERTNGKIKDKIYVKIGLFCGGAPNLNAYKYYMFAHKVKEENLNSIYRGFGWPGNNVFEYNDGKKILLPKQPTDFWGSTYYTLSFLPVFAQKRCLSCIDRFSSFADISVGDAWLARFRDDKKGTSLIITRNDEIDRILLEMKKEGYIYFDSISEDEVIRAQGRFLEFYNNVYTTHKILLRKAPVVDLPAGANRINYSWLAKLGLTVFGMKLSEQRPLWKFLFIYGIFFRYANMFINYAAAASKILKKKTSTRYD